MKKLFTLIAATLFAVGMNAKEAVDLSSIYASGTTIEFAGGWSWQGVNFATGELIQNTEAGTTDDSNVTYYDASAFDYLVLKYNSTTDVNFIIQYNANGVIGQWGPEFYQGQQLAAKNAKGGLVAIKLDDHKNKINSVAFQNQNDPGSLTVEEIYWASTAEYEAALAEQPVVTTQDVDYTTFGSYNAEQGAFVFAAGGAGWHSKWFGTFDVAEWNTLVIEVESTNGDVQFLMQGDHADGAPENMMILKSDAPQKYILDISGWTNISQMAFQNFNFPDPSIEDWATKEATAQETTMKVTAMYISKDAAPAEAKTVFSWVGGEEGATVTGGTVTGNGADAESVNMKNSSYYVIRVSSKKATIDTDNVTITLDEALQADDEIAITAYRNKDTDANGTLYMLFENGTVIDEGDNVVWNNIHANVGQEPNTNTYKVGDAAGSKTIKLARSKSSTNVFITAISINRGGVADSIEQVKSVVLSNGAIYNLRGQRVDASYKGIVIRDGKKFLQK